MERELKEIAGVPLHPQHQMKSDGNGGFAAPDRDVPGFDANREEDGSMDSLGNTEQRRDTSDRDEEKEGDENNEEDEEQQLPPLRSHHIGSPPHHRTAHADNSKIVDRAAGVTAHRYKSSHPKSTKITINMDGNENGGSSKKSHRNGHIQDDEK